MALAISNGGTSPAEMRSTALCGTSRVAARSRHWSPIFILRSRKYPSVTGSEIYNSPVVRFTNTECEIYNYYNYQVLNLWFGFGALFCLLWAPMIPIKNWSRGNAEVIQILVDWLTGLPRAEFSLLCRLHDLRSRITGLPSLSEPDG